MGRSNTRYRAEADCGMKNDKMYIHFSVPIESVLRLAENGQVYISDKTRAYEAIVRLQATRAMRGKKMLSGPISLSVTAFLPVPEHYFARAFQEKALAGELLHTKNPSWGDIGKIVSAALNGVVYADDAIVSAGAVIKRYSDYPRLEVRVAEMGQVSADLSWRLC